MILKTGALIALLVDVHLCAQAPMGSISGKVTCGLRPPQTAAAMVLTDELTKRERTFSAEVTGTFVLREVPAGYYKLSAAALQCEGPDSGTFHLDAGESRRIDFFLTRVERVAADRSGPPPPPPPPMAAERRKRRAPPPKSAAPPPPPPPPAPAPTPPPLPAAPAPAPVPEAVANQNYWTVRIFYATDRQRADTSQPALFYGGGRHEAGGSAYEVGQCDVSIPFGHQEGEMESPVWWKLEFRPDPERDIVLLSVMPEDSVRYFSEMRARVAHSPEKDAFVFVHGYNTTFEDAARRTAQMAYDLKFQGAPILYSWPSQGELLKYTYDENNVEWSWRHLYDFLQTVSQQSGATTIHLIAHSMGNRALTNALQRMPKLVTPQFREVILAAPDIDADSFKQMAADMKGKANRITLYASSKDEALKASKVAHGEPRAGDSDRILVVDGVDSIDASAAATDFLGHGYVFKDSILFDMAHLFKQDRPPQQRDKLKQETLGSLFYWLLTP